MGNKFPIPEVNYPKLQYVTTKDLSKGQILGKINGYPNNVYVICLLNTSIYSSTEDDFKNEHNGGTYLCDLHNLDDYVNHIYIHNGGGIYWDGVYNILSKLD